MGDVGGTATDKQWADLNWDELTQWAGVATVDRGRRYQEAGAVLSVGRRADGAIVARVSGGDVYNTVVRLTDNPTGGRLWSDCSCPVGYSCKHAVAAVLEYLQRLQTGVDVAAEPDAGASGGAGPDRLTTIAEYLEGLPKDELAAMLFELAEEDEALAQRLYAMGVAACGDIEAAIAAARLEMEEVTAEEVWYDYRARELHAPDYSILREHLRNLSAAGLADAVLELGLELIHLGTLQVEDAHEDQEGETGYAIAHCLEVVWMAVKSSSLSPAERIIWLLDAGDLDDYGLCMDASSYIDENAGPDVWGEVADRLLARLEAAGADCDDYDRVRMSERIARALERAGRTDEALDISLAQASQGKNVVAAVDRLVAAGRLEEAKGLARRTIAELGDADAYTAEPLRDRLRDIAVQEGDLPLAAAFRAGVFLARFTRSAYVELRQAATDAGLWADVRDILFEAVERGELPYDRVDWPLPRTDLPTETRELLMPARNRYVLMEMALSDGDVYRVLSYLTGLGDEWLEQLGERVSDEVASALATRHPTTAVDIWLALAEDSICRTNQSAYAAGIGYLKPVRRLLCENGQGTRWERVLADIRERHKRKRTLMKMLDTVREGPIIGG